LTLDAERALDAAHPHALREHGWRRNSQPRCYAHFNEPPAALVAADISLPALTSGWCRAGRVEFHPRSLVLRRKPRTRSSGTHGIPPNRALASGSGGPNGDSHVCAIPSSHRMGPIPRLLAPHVALPGRLPRNARRATRRAHPPCGEELVMTKDSRSATSGEPEGWKRELQSIINRFTPLHAR